MPTNELRVKLFKRTYPNYRELPPAEQKKAWTTFVQCFNSKRNA